MELPKNIVVYNEQTHSLDEIADLETCKNFSSIQVNIPPIFTKEDLENLSDSVINEMTRLRSAYIETKEIKKAVNVRLSELQILHSKICNLIF